MRLVSYLLNSTLYDLYQFDIFIWEVAHIILCYHAFKHEPYLFLKEKFKKKYKRMAYEYYRDRKFLFVLWIIILYQIAIYLAVKFMYWVERKYFILNLMTTVWFINV